MCIAFIRIHTINRMIQCTWYVYTQRWRMEGVSERKIKNIIIICLFSCFCLMWQFGYRFWHISHRSLVFVFSFLFPRKQTHLLCVAVRCHTHFGSHSLIYTHTHIQTCTRISHTPTNNHTHNDDLFLFCRFYLYLIWIL